MLLSCLIACFSSKQFDLYFSLFYPENVEPFHREFFKNITVGKPFSREQYCQAWKGKISIIDDGKLELTFSNYDILYSQNIANMRLKTIPEIMLKELELCYIIKETATKIDSSIICRRQLKCPSGEKIYTFYPLEYEIRLIRHGW
jgi:hypothetical protein